MAIEELELLKYPIGKFQKPETLTEKHIQLWIQDVALLPHQIRQAVNELTDEQLGTPYRPDGWTVRQVVHHVADSHMNAYIRFKLALTEENPTIKPYEEALWAELPDSKMDIEISLNIIDNLHARWVTILRGMTEKDFEQTFFHPAQQKSSALKTIVGMYSWHGRHHVAHITNLKIREGWQ